MPAPTFVASYATADFNDPSEPKTVSVTTLAGDLVVILAHTKSEIGFLSVTQANGISLTHFNSYPPAFGEMGVDGWHGIDATGGTNWTLELSYSDFIEWGFICYVFRGSNGFGGNNISIGNTVGSVQLTTTAANSAVVVYRAEIWGNLTTETWLTVNSITPTVGNSLVKLNDPSTNDLIMSAYYNDVGAAGLNTYGISPPSSNHASVLALEILGSSGAGGNTIAAPWITA